MSTFDPNERPPRVRSGDAGGGWIVGIIVVVLIGLGIWWWAGTGNAVPHTASTRGTAPATTTGSAPASPTPATPPRATPGAAK